MAPSINGRLRQQEKEERVDRGQEKESKEYGRAQTERTAKVGFPSLAWSNESANCQKKANGKGAAPLFPLSVGEVSLRRGGQRSTTDNEFNTAAGKTNHKLE